MKIFLLLFLVCFTLECVAQQPGKILISCILTGPDSVAVPDVAIIDVSTGKTVRTNSNGFFQIEVAKNDSLLAFHIAYKKRFITENDNGKSIILEPQLQEIMQVDVIDKRKEEQKNLEQTVDDIKRIAPNKKLSGFDLHTRQEYFLRDHGSHDKAFSPFFGPTTRLSTGQIAQQFSKIRNRRELKKITSHYHLVKNKK